VWANTHDNAVYVLHFNGGVLKDNIGANLNLWEGSGVFVVLFDLLLVQECFLVSFRTALPLWGKSSVVGWKRVLDGTSKQLLCR